MAHPQQKEFVQSVKDKFPLSFLYSRVLEIGSYNINGTVRDFFEHCNYTGVDVSEGAGVDVISKGHEYKSNKKFDVAISCECFEHDPYWKLTFNNMFNHLRHGGLLLFTCASTGRPEHGTINTRPQDSLSSGIEEMGNYYGNLDENDFEDTFMLPEMFSEYHFAYNSFSCDLYFYGIKK